MQSKEWVVNRLLQYFLGVATWVFRCDLISILDLKTRCLVATRTQYLKDLKMLAFWLRDAFRLYGPVSGKLRCEVKEMPLWSRDDWISCICEFQWYRVGWNHAVSWEGWWCGPSYKKMATRNLWAAESTRSRVTCHHPVALLGSDLWKKDCWLSHVSSSEIWCWWCFYIGVESCSLLVLKILNNGGIRRYRGL